MDGHHRVGFIKVHGIGEVLEDPERLGSFVCRGADLEGVDFHGLVESQGQDDLLVAVGLEESPSGREAVVVGVIVGLVKTLALGLGQILEQILLESGKK